MLEIVLALAACSAILAAGASQRRWLPLRTAARGLLITYATLVLLVAMGEAYFRYVYADSVGILSSRNWMDRHWTNNSFGYRDREWSESDWAGKTTVGVVGDSFTAGWGIDQPADRFSDVLARALGEAFAVFNLGRPGTSTYEHLEAVRDFPVELDVVIWQYFLNDIEYSLLRLGLNILPLERPRLVDESYLADFLYSRTTGTFGSDYWQRLYASFDSAPIWEVHEAEIHEFAAMVQHRNSRLILVIFPNMVDPVVSIQYVDRVAQAAQDAGVTGILRLFDAAAATPVDERIVSPRDTHPSVAFHHYVGERIAHEFFLNAGQ